MINAKDVQFVICAPSYSEVNGGAIVLHKLCHILNSNGFNAFLYPFYGAAFFDGTQGLNFINNALRLYYRKYFRRFAKNDDFNTPLLSNARTVKKG